MPTRVRARSGLLAALYAWAFAGAIGAQTPPDAPAGDFPPAVTAALSRAFARADAPPDGARAAFLRYADGGRLETFDCPRSVGLDAFPSRFGAMPGTAVGACTADASLDRRFAERQLEALHAALGATSPLHPAAWKELVATMLRPQVVDEGDVTYVHVALLLMGGIGGAAGQGAELLETMVALERGRATTIVVQAPAMHASCRDANGPADCAGLRAALRALAHEVRALQ